MIVGGFVDDFGGIVDDDIDAAQLLMIEYQYLVIQN